jgi:transposase
VTTNLPKTSKNHPYIQRISHHRYDPTKEFRVKQKTAIGNQVIAILLEFNIRFSSRNGGLEGAVESTLEGAENGLPIEFREALDASWRQFLAIIKSINTYDNYLEKVMEMHSECRKTTQT